jgi:hypothetical protein
MVLIHRGPQSSHSVTRGGAIPDGMFKRDISGWAQSHKPRMTPLLSKIGVGRPLISDPPEWGTKARTNITTTLAAAMTDVATTAVFAAGTGVLTHKYMVLEIIDYVPATTTLDMSSRELVWLSDNSTGDTNTTVVRGQGGTVASAHEIGALVKLHSVAEPQLQEHPLGPIARGTTQYNYYQRFAEGIIVDIAVDNTATEEFPNGNSSAYDIEEMTLRQKLFLEQAIWSGGRQQGNAATGATSMMGGIDTFITTNVTDVGGAALTPRVLERELSDLWKSVDDAAAKTLLMDYDTASIFDTLLEPIKRAGVQDTTYSMFIDRVRFRSGVYDIGVSRWCPPGTIYIVNLDAMKVHPRRNANWHTAKKDGEMHGVDHNEYYVSGDFTFILEDETTMAKLHNFDTDVANYDV